MHLTPRELDKLVLHQAGFLAQKRLARGVRLNYPEAVALIATQLLEFIRETKFERLGVFAYSQEEGTVAGRMANQLPEKARQKRRERAMAEQHKVARAVGESFVGRTLRVLVEKEANAKELAGANISSWEHGLIREADKAAAALCDAQWRLVWVSEEMKVLLDEHDEEKLGYGKHVLEAYLSDTWALRITQETQARMFMEHFPRLIADTPGGKERLSEIFRAALARWAEGGGGADVSHVDVLEVFEGKRGPKWEPDELAAEREVAAGSHRSNGSE